MGAFWLLALMRYLQINRIRVCPCQTTGSGHSRLLRCLPRYGPAPLPPKTALPLTTPSRIFLRRNQQAGVLLRRDALETCLEHVNRTCSETAICTPSPTPNFITRMGSCWADATKPPVARRNNLSAQCTRPVNLRREQLADIKANIDPSFSNSALSPTFKP